MTDVDDKTKERALLLVRFYWLEDIYNLGQDLNIPYLDRFRNYWDIDYDKGYKEAAVEIAKAVSDNELLRIVKQKPPRYRLELAGFQGNYYRPLKVSKRL